MKLIAINDKAKCAGEDNTGNQVCSDRERCGRYMRPSGDYQWWIEFWRAGKDCQNFESFAAEHNFMEQPSKLEW